MTDLTIEGTGAGACSSAASPACAAAAQLTGCCKQCTSTAVTQSSQRITNSAKVGGVSAYTASMLPQVRCLQVVSLHPGGEALVGVQDHNGVPQQSDCYSHCSTFAQGQYDTWYSAYLQHYCCHWFTILAVQNRDVTAKQAAC